MDRTPRALTQFRLLLGGCAWILTPLYFVGQILVQAAWTTPYSMIDNRVSDLGNTTCGTTVANTYICSPLHAVMNVTFIRTGMLILIGVALTHSVWPPRHLTTWGLIMLGVAGAGTILVGLSPENVHIFIHVVGAVNIPAGNVAMILLGLAIWRDRRGPDRVGLVLGPGWDCWPARNADWTFPDDLDRPWGWIGRTNSALSADHLAGRCRSVVC
jgi:hypothetical membrane protein